MQKKLVLQSEAKVLSGIRQQMRDFLNESGFSEKDKDNILVALCEGVTNAIRHSYQEKTGGRIEVTLEDFKDKTRFKIRDFGQKIDLSKIRPPKLPPENPHGLGIYFMKTIMDEFGYNTAHAVGNELVMVKYKTSRKKPE